MTKSGCKTSYFLTDCAFSAASALALLMASQGFRKKQVAEAVAMPKIQNTKKQIV
jgi:hypothetical protein